MNGNTNAWRVVAVCMLIAGCGDLNSPTGSAEQQTRSDKDSAVGPSEGQAGISRSSPDIATPLTPTSLGLPAQSAEIGVHDTNDGEAVEIKPGGSVAGSFSAPADGAIRILHVTVGNYGGASDGELEAMLCVDASCVKSRHSLAGSTDNAYFPFEFDEPLQVKLGATLRYAVTRLSGSTPFAVWSYGRSSESRVKSFTGVDGTASAKTPRLAVTYR